MKKHFSIKPLVIAAAIMTTGAVSVLGASAATKTTSDRTAPITITYKQTDSAELPENAEQSAVSYTIEALAEVGTVKFNETESPFEYYEVTATAPFTDEQKTLYQISDEDGRSTFEISGVTIKSIGEDFDDLTLVVNNNGTVAHYRINYNDGMTYAIWSPDGSHDDDWIRID